MRKVVLLALLFIGACELEKVEPQKKPSIKVASRELQDFKDEVCPAALNGLRAVTEDRVMDAGNFRDTTVLMDLREAAAMFQMVMDECLKTSSPTPDTSSSPAPTPDSTSETKEASNVRIALSFPVAPTTVR